MVTLEPTLQDVMVARLADSPYLNDPEPDGLGFTKVYPKWLVDGDGPGAEPDAFNTAGRIKPAIVVIMPDSGENAHPSVHVPGWNKWDAFPYVYLFHWPSERGKQILQMAKLEVERVLADQSTWHPVITGGQRPKFEVTSEVHLDNSDQFPGNYVIRLTVRVTGARTVPVS